MCLFLHDNVFILSQSKYSYIHRVGSFAEARVMFTSIIFLIAYVVTGQAITDLNVIVVTSERTVSDFIAANSNFTYISLNAEVIHNAISIV